MNVTLKLNATIICGMRNSGKSEIARTLILAEKDKFDIIFAISPTDACNGFYNFIEKQNVIEDYSEEWVDALISKMKDKNLGKNARSPDAYHCLLVIDDCGGNSGWKNSRSLEALFSKGRHYMISTLVIIQRIRSVSVTVRTNVNFLYVSVMNASSEKILLEEFTLGDISKIEFKNLLKKETQNYGFLIINNSASTQSISLNSYYASIRVPIDKLKVR